MRPPPPDTLPRAWDQEELRRLFEGAAWEPGFVGGVLARKWWTAYLAFAWSTAERKGALLALRWEWVDLERQLAVIPAAARKGKRKPAVYHLWPEVVAVLREIKEPARELVFPWDRSEGCYYTRFSRILKRAGLPVGRKFKTHALRVSHATWTDLAGGDASRSLKHSDPATTRASYLDERLRPPEERKLFVPWL